MLSTWSEHGHSSKGRCPLSEDKKNRIIESRMRLRQRFLDEMARTPSIADDAPMGTGPLNRHGMPRLPIGQVETAKWPVLDLGIHPDVSTDAWRLTIDGAVGNELNLDWNRLMSLEQVNDIQDFHCVTTWSRCDLDFTGVRLSTVLALAEPLESATHLMCHAYDGYTTNLSLIEALKDDVLLVHTWDGHPLPREHGGPVRVVTPQLYAWKGAKWIKRIEVMTVDRRGYWEQRGYSNTAYPWRNDRYSEDTESGE